MPLTERDYDLISLYIDDALTPPERHALESRLKSDAEFRAELDALRRTVALVKSLPEIVAPRDLRLTPEMAADVLAELKAAQPIRKNRRPIIHTLTTIAAAAASLVLVLAGALMLLQPEIGSRPQMTAGTGATVAVADAVLTEKISTETPTLKTGEDGTTMGLMAPQGTLEPFATGGFGGAVDPAADTAVMQEEAETSAPDIFSAVPAPVVTGSEEPPSTMMEEMEAPGDSPQATPTRALATAPATVSAVGRMAASIEPTDAAMAEMSMPPMTALPADEVIETVVADAEDDRAGQDEANDFQREAAPITEPSSPILGFALVIAGVALGVVALIIQSRTP